MLIHSPCIITPRLCAGVQIGDAFISIEYAERNGDENRTRYQYHIDIPGEAEFSDDDLQFGNGSGGLQSGLSSLLSFLGAAAESYDHAQRTGREGENTNLFPAYIVEWASENSDELSMLSYELEETDTIVIEE